jgi:flavodoxin
MNIGIIIYSQTGNTLSVAERLKDALQKAGHTVRLERVDAENENPNTKGSLRLKTLPDISKYDALIFGSPVQGFNLSPVMKAYLAQIPDLHGKNASCYVTQHFKKAWLGGNQAIKQMTAALVHKGAGVTDTGIVNWTGKTREDQINSIVAVMSRV